MDQLDQNRELIQDDLRGLVTGEVRCNDVHLQLYASDASVYEIRPVAVVRPRSTADVVAVVQYASEKGIPVHARGAGSGVAGESIGPGIVLDFSRFLRRVLRFEGETVRVQPGIVLERLNAQLRVRGQVFGPDPSNALTTTLGSVLSVDAAGSRWLKYGSARTHVRSLQIVLAGGKVMEVGREPLALLDDPAAPEDKRELMLRVVKLLGDHAQVIRANHPQTPVSRCGYNLADVLSTEHIDLARLLVGSEGTLALITEASVATQPLCRHRGVVLLLFESLEKASRAALEIVRQGVSACDLIDRRHVSLARELEPRYESLIPPETEALLLVELEGDEAVEVRERLRLVVEDVVRQRRLAFAARHAFDQEDADFFWRIVDRFQPALNRVRGAARPVPVVEDIVVPPAVLPEFLVRTQNALKRQQVTASVFCHAGQGQLHLQPFLDLGDPSDLERMQRLAEELYQEVFDVGGTIGGEHACGLSRTPFVRRQAGPLYDVFRELKAIFDPLGILNPGKIVGDGAESLTRDLRPPLVPRAAEPLAQPPAAKEGSRRLRNLVELQLNWDPMRVLDATAACNRCGDCRTQAPDTRMCPMFRCSPSEEASPRAKANLLRGVLTGRIDLGRLASDDLKRVADLCVHCHQCRIECPARVDIPRIMRETKAAYVQVNGLAGHDWVATHLDLLGSLGTRVSSVANWALSHRWTRWLMEKSLGIAQGRKLPRVASQSFLRRAARRRLTRTIRRGGRKVAYFVDAYANYFDAGLGEALVAVLKRNGISVHVPQDQVQAGMPAIACGSLDHARRLARQNIAVLSEAVRQGYDIVATEPAAVLCLTHEYPQLIDDDDTRLVAAHASEACTYLWNLHTKGGLQLDFRPINATVGYHLPCHLKALEVGSPGENLLRLIPGLSVVRLEEGCSGMAGTFGLLHRNYRASLRAGWGLISRLRDSRLQFGATECSACKLQMEQGTTKPTIHPIRLLALAYGLTPDLETMLDTPGSGLLAT